MRRQFIETWHQDIQANLDVEKAVASTDGFSFAEIEELKNLLIMHFMNTTTWDWDWALNQFQTNRVGLTKRAARHVGF